MNTTASTFSSRIPDVGPYTVIGGHTLDRTRKVHPGISIILLNRGNRPFRRDLFDELCHIGAREILSVESSPCPHDVDALSQRHDILRFIIFPRDRSTGVRIDVAMREASSEYIFVIQGDMRINATEISSRVFAKISECGRLCTVPVFRNSNGELIPTAVSPMPGKNGVFDIQPAGNSGREIPTLIPWDYTGIYCREKHFGIGGFDSRISEPWWQKMDYGMRAWLWGEEIRTHSALRMGYLDEKLPEDTTPGPGYRRFFLKNLAVKRRGDTGRLGRAGWWSYLHSSGESAVAARQTWKDVRNWVYINRYRFLRDVAEITELWEWGE